MADLDLLGGHGVLIERGPDGTAALFDCPSDVVVVRDLSQVSAALDRLEAARRSGKWIAGLAGYELGLALEPALAGLMPEHRAQPLLQFGIFDAPRDGADVLARADARADQAQVTSAAPLWSEARYAEAFDQIKGMLGRGDLYQVNLTMPLDVRFDGDALALWGALRGVQPVGHAAIVDLGAQPVLSRSPELFFRLDADGMAEVAPMKGTAPRDADPLKDAALRNALAADEKNRAENVMIIDLMRNDLSRISQVGSVRPVDLLKIETYRTVHQMVSRVRSRLLPGMGLPDILTALFPCGSITGAPKIAAMQAISALEQRERGAYCGSIGWMAPDGRAEFNVAIRTLVLTEPGRAEVSVGGGIVQDSTCDGEYEEALWKARFVTQLIKA